MHKRVKMYKCLKLGTQVTMFAKQFRWPCNTISLIESVKLGNPNGRPRKIMPPFSPFDSEVGPSSLDVMMLFLGIPMEIREAIMSLLEETCFHLLSHREPSST